MNINEKTTIHVEHRLTRLEEGQKDIKEDIVEIKDNHLVHIQDDINKLDSRTWWILSTVILGFLASIFLNIFTNI